MHVFRCILISVFLIIGLGQSLHSASLDSLLNPKSTKFSPNHEVVFRSTDKVNLDLPRKIVLSNDNKYLYFLGKKGLYTVDLSNYSTNLNENKLYLSRSTAANEAYQRSVVIDSVESLEINQNNKLIELKNISIDSTSFKGYATMIGRQTRFSNLNFPYSDFLTISKFNSQSNLFKIVNIISDHVGNYYFTAIDDNFQISNPCNACPFYSIGGSEIKGTYDVPNIYKIQDVPQVKFNFRDYSSSNVSPNFLKVGSGIAVLVDKSGSYFTIEQDRIIKWSPDGKTSELVAGGNGKGQGLNQLILNTMVQKPIEIDSKGNLLINDYYNRRVLYWPKGQKYGEIIASDKMNKIPNFLPNSIALDAEENIYISDESNNSQIIQLKNCAYLPKPVINKISNEELLTSSQFQPKWFVNNKLISSETTSALKPKITGFYKVQLTDSWGCTSVPSDSVFYNCMPAKPEIEQISKSELKAIPIVDLQLYAGFSYSISNYGLVKFTNLSKNQSGQTWIFSDGTNSNELNSTKYFASSGSYLVKLQVKNLKGEIVNYQENILIKYPERPNVVYTSLGNNTFRFKSYENEEIVYWDFGDRGTSLETSPIHKFSFGTYAIKLVLNGNGYTREVKIDLFVNSPVDLKNGKVVDIPIGNSNSLWSDFSGYSNDANYNGKSSILTHQGIFPGYSFSAINLPGCNVVNLNERIQIPNSNTLNNYSEITFSGWFGVDPSISMDPADGSCKPNGRQVLFSKGGDGFETSPPGFNSLLDIRNKEISLRLEFSKNSGDFSVNIPITKLIDTVKTQEKFESKYFVSGYQVISPDLSWPIISSMSRLGEYVSPFQHFVISFSETNMRLYLNGIKIYDNVHSIKFNEINAQDLYVGSMGPKTIPFNSILNWYPFKGRIDKIKVYNRMITDAEANALYLEKNSND